MRLDRYITKSRIVDLESRDLPSALRELIGVATRRLNEPIQPEEVVESLLQRENTITTYLGNGVALPHLRLPLKRPYLIAVGRCREGLEYNGLSLYRETRLLFLLLASEKEKNYLHVLASLARLFNDKALVEKIALSPDLESLRDNVLLGFGSVLARPARRQQRFNQFILKEAEKVARTAKCAAILLFSDTFAGGIEVSGNFPRYRTVIVSRSAAKRYLENRNVVTTIEVRSYSRARLSQSRSAILIGLTSGIFKYNDRLCCVGGIAGSNQLDTITIVDIELEFKAVMTQQGNLLPPSVKLEVFERLLAIATDLSIEGREGKPVGALFVIGDTERVNSMIKPLVLNPFFGYREEERNLLNPFMDETIKEFSVIDGCFVIRGNGVIESAGSLIHAPTEFYRNMPSGLGSRHAAAAAISLAADCASIVVSSSTGQVSLFRRGVMLPLLEKSMAQTR